MHRCLIIAAVACALCVVGNGSANDKNTAPDIPVIPVATSSDTSLGTSSTVPDHEKREVLVSHIINGACFRGDGWEKYCLAGIGVPALAPIDANRVPEPFAVAARELLYRYIFNRTVTVTIIGKANRWGTEYVMLSGIEELKEPIQHLFLSRGLAYVAEKPAGLGDHLYEGFRQQQQKARYAGAKMWQSDRFAVLTAETAEAGIGQYRYVRGTVLSTAVTRDRVYLNFGPDYRTDFTITIESPLYRTWAREGFDVSVFEGRKVEVYGRLKSINGPSLGLRDKTRLVILPESPDGNTAQTP